MYVLFNILAIAVMFFFVGMLSEVGDMGSLTMIPLGLYILAIFIPSLAVVVRRLHDINKSGWYILVLFIPFVGSIWLFVLLCTEGTSGPNKYGPDPKNPLNELEDIGIAEA